MYLANKFRSVFCNKPQLNIAESLQRRERKRLYSSSQFLFGGNQPTSKSEAGGERLLDLVNDRSTLHRPNIQSVGGRELKSSAVQKGTKKGVGKGGKLQPNR